MAATRSYRSRGARFGDPRDALNAPSRGAPNLAAIDARLTASAKGRQQKQGGQTSEALFQRTHDAYARAGLATITKQHPPVAGTPGALKYAGGAHVDFIGALAPTGRCLAFDLKGVTGHPTLSLPKIQPLSHKHHARSVRDRQRMIDQAQLMLELRRSGAAVAFVCVDMQRARCWIMTEVERIAAAEDVPLRRRDQDLWPAVAFASLEAIARGAPQIDYLSVWPGLR